MSVEGKGRPGPQTGSRGFQCKFCEITLASRDTLKEHSLRKHAWDIQTGAAASPEVLSKLKVRDSKKVEKKGNKKTEGDTQNTGSRELFGEISDESDVEIDETGPPGSLDVSLPPGQPRNNPPSTSNTSAERAAQLTGWDDIARPIDQTNHPCEKRRIEKHLAVRSLSAPPTKRGKTQEISGRNGQTELSLPR